MWLNNIYIDGYGNWVIVVGVYIGVFIRVIVCCW